MVGRASISSRDCSNHSALEAKKGMALGLEWREGVVVM